MPKKNHIPIYLTFSFLLWVGIGFCQNTDAIEHTSYQGDDKGVIVLCNGKTLDFSIDADTIQKINVEYWGCKLIEILKKETKNKNDIIYRNGNIENPQKRYEIGVKAGKKDAVYIKSKLGRNGTVKLISHSEGTAYAIGYIKGLTQTAPSIKIAWNIMLAPRLYKKWEFKIEECNLNIGIQHLYDKFSSKITSVYPNSTIFISEKMLSEDLICRKINLISEKIGKKMGEEIEEHLNEITEKQIKKGKNGKQVYKKLESSINKIIRKTSDILKEEIKQNQKNIETAVDDARQNITVIHSINGFHFELKAAIHSLLNNKNIFNTVKRAKKDYWDGHKYRDPAQLIR